MANNMDDIFTEPGPDEIPAELSGQLPAAEDAELKKILSDADDDDAELINFLNQNITEILEAVSDYLPGRWQMTEKEIDRFSKPLSRIIDKYIPIVASDGAMLILFSFLYFNKRLNITGIFKNKKTSPAAGEPERKNQAAYANNDNPSEPAGTGKNKIIRFEEARKNVKEKLPVQGQQQKIETKSPANNKQPAKNNFKNGEEDNRASGDNQATGNQSIFNGVGQTGKNASDRPERRSSNGKEQTGRGQQKISNSIRPDKKTSGAAGQKSKDNKRAARNLSSQQQKIRANNKRASGQDKKIRKRGRPKKIIK